MLSRYPIREAIRIAILGSRCDMYRDTCLSYRINQWSFRGGRNSTVTLRSTDSEIDFPFPSVDKSLRLAITIEMQRAQNYGSYNIRSRRYGFAAYS